MNFDLKKVSNAVNAFSSELLDSFSLTNFVNQVDVDNQYKKQKSFTDFLSIIEYLPEEKAFLLEDCKTFAVGIKFKTINVEGFPERTKADYRNILQNALEQYIPRYATNPVVANIYFSNQYNLEECIERVKNFGELTPFKKRYNEIMERHLSGITNEKGIFHDTEVTDQPFSGKSSTGYIFLYRRGSTGTKTQTNLEEILQLRDKLIASFSKIGSHFEFETVTANSLYNWLFPIFNKSDLSERDLLKKYPYPGDYDVPVGRDFSTLLTLAPPKSDVKNKLWNFGNRKARFVGAESIKYAPKIGAFTASTNKGSLFDSMPAGVIMSMTIVFLDQDVVNKEFEVIKKKAVGDSAEAEAAREEAVTALRMTKRAQPILPIEIGFYVFANDDHDMLRKEQLVSDACSDAGLQMMSAEYDLLNCDTFIKFLPCNYRWSQNNVRQRTIKCTMQHICNLMPLLGKGRGSGTPVNVKLNRSGEEMFFDVINDKAANCHMTMIGSSGAGKSASLVEMFFAYLAQHNARFFIIEKGKSFKRAVDYVSKYDISVNSMELTRKSKLAIPPYANAYKALEQNLSEEDINTPAETNIEIAEKLDDPDYEDEPKDYLGEMELLTKILCTGGDKKLADEFGVIELSLVRKAILKAAETCKAQGKKHPLVEDVAVALKGMDSDKLRQKHRDKIADMAEALEYYCTGLAGHLFNREGELWPEADVTHIDLGDLTRDGKHAELSVAYASILNNINDIAERDQHTGRPTIVLTDEAHNVVSNTSKASAILVPAIVKIVKMFRKINVANWMATQNVTDFCAEAEAILKLNEWSLVLTVERGEDEDIARLKRLSEEEKSLMSSVTKEDKKYTEGFVSCRNSRITNQLFRNIPASIILVMGWSDPKEKKAIADKMVEMNCDELVATELIADEIDKLRGIIN